MEDETLPDLPELLSALEQTLSEFKDIDDFTKISKYKLATNQNILFDALKDIVTYVIAKMYQLDLAVKGLNRLHTMLSDMIEAGELDIPDFKGNGDMMVI